MPVSYMIMFKARKIWKKYASNLEICWYVRSSLKEEIKKKFILF